MLRVTALLSRSGFFCDDEAETQAGMRLLLKNPCLSIWAGARSRSRSWSILQLQYMQTLKELGASGITCLVEASSILSNVPSCAFALAVSLLFLFINHIYCVHRCKMPRSNMARDKTLPRGLTIPLALPLLPPLQRLHSATSLPLRRRRPVRGASGSELKCVG